MRVSLVGSTDPRNQDKENHGGDKPLRPLKYLRNFPKVRVAVLGAGKMGGILLQAFLKQTYSAPIRFTPL